MRLVRFRIKSSKEQVLDSWRAGRRTRAFKRAISSLVLNGLASRGEHNNGSFDSLFADDFENLEAGHFGEHNVEDNGIVNWFFGEGEPIFAVVCPVDIDVGFFEQMLDGIG